MRRPQRAASGPASSIDCRTSRRWRRRLPAPGSRWKASRSPARGSIGNGGSCRRSCSKWAGRRTSARGLRPGERVILMGPTGTPTEIESGETVVLAGRRPRQRGAVLDRPGVPRTPGSKVLYFAGYKKRVDRYKVADIEAAADAVVWCCDEAPGFEPTRPQDRAFVGNIVEAMHAYASGALGAQPVPFADCERLIAIGSDAMMAAVGGARQTVLAPHLPRARRALASINSPMQCMMKEICAQCLQPQRDPGDGQGDVRLLVLQPGPAARSRRFSGPGRAPRAEFGAGEADRAVDRAIASRRTPATRTSARARAMTTRA